MALSAGSGLRVQKPMKSKVKSMAFSTGLLQTSPRPVAMMLIVSPGTAGFAGVISVPAALAQHNWVLVAVRRLPAPAVWVGSVEVVVEMGVLPPPGPGTFACRRMRVNPPAAEAVTGEPASAL